MGFGEVFSLLGVREKENGVVFGRSREIKTLEEKLNAPFQTFARLANRSAQALRSIGYRSGALGRFSRSIATEAADRSTAYWSSVLLARDRSADFARPLGYGSALVKCLMGRSRDRSPLLVRSIGEESV